MNQQSREQGCLVLIIYGMNDYVLCLFLRSREKSISEEIKQIKGGTSQFTNHNNLIPVKFSWQSGYAAYSVSESGVELVFQYIKNQKIHHQKI